jgi:hypothetical protein
MLRRDLLRALGLGVAATTLPQVVKADAEPMLKGDPAILPKPQIEIHVPTVHKFSDNPAKLLYMQLKANGALVGPLHPTLAKSGGVIGAKSEDGFLFQQKSVSTASGATLTDDYIGALGVSILAVISTNWPIAPRGRVRFADLLVPRKVMAAALYHYGEVSVRVLQDYCMGTDEILSRVDALFYKYEV